MLKLVRTHTKNKDFINLIKKLDDYLAIVDGDEHDFYNQYNSIDALKSTVVAYSNNIPVGCGAIKEFDKNSVEIKRMYTSPECRGKGVASKILKELEVWSNELGYKSCILETGKRQIEAVELYKKNNYNIISNFGPYKNVENSLCFKKELSN